MSRIRLYVDDAGRCALHSSGFSWMAGLLPPIWALQRRLYGLAALAVAYSIAVNLLLAPLGDGPRALLLVVQVALFGALANRLHGALLARRGWRLTAEESSGPAVPPAGDGRA